MRVDVIDRALRDESRISPSPDFAHRVMRQVRQEADRQRAMPFPWLLLAGGLVLAGGAALAGALLGEVPQAAVHAGRLVDLGPALAWLSTALAGSLGVTWWSVRFAGR